MWLGNWNNHSTSKNCAVMTRDVISFHMQLIFFFCLFHFHCGWISDSVNSMNSNWVMATYSFHPHWYLFNMLWTSAFTFLQLEFVVGCIKSWCLTKGRSHLDHLTSHAIALAHHFQTKIFHGNASLRCFISNLKGIQQILPRFLQQRAIKRKKLGFLLNFTFYQVT